MSDCGKRYRLILTAWIFCALSASVLAQGYVVPANNRTNLSLNAGWRFLRQDAAGAQTNTFDDSTWTNLDLPHTWNNLDGQDGGNNYYRGIGWYRRHYFVDPSYTNRCLFLKFNGAFYVADVYVNGTFIGEHQGGFGAFDFDVTTNLNIGGDNVIAVKVSNAANSNIAPISADFTFFGGLYRDVSLIVTDPLQISPLDFGSPGVYLQPTNVSAISANLQVTTVVSNANPTDALVTVRSVITDATTNIVSMFSNIVTIPAMSSSNVQSSALIANQHLWNGLADPYLYRAFVEIYNGTNLTDLVSQPLGFRWFSVDPTNGFFLNGHYYDLHGVCMHQDYLNLGWALTDAQRATNFMFLKELGVTAIRLSHYEHDDNTYDLADKNGIILWSEIPLVNTVTESSAFYNNAKQQLRELIRQRFNHPAVICWGMFNELSLGVSTAMTNLVYQLVQLEAQEDPTRPSTAAILASNGDANAFYPQMVAFNEYYGWYGDPLNGIAAWADAIHANHPNSCIGISEYGAGGSIYQHSEDPVAKPGTSGAPFHPEEWQNIVHETNWQLMKARPFLWCKFLWNMFNFAVDGRNEGDTPGRNDKGLVTYDRLVRKDVFYYYKANWTTNPMVYITGHTFTNRLANTINAKVYANCDLVELFLNGVSQGIRTSSNNIFIWPIVLSSGSNFVQAVGTAGGTQTSDSLFWIAPLSVTITNPVASVIYLNSTNDTLQLGATTLGVTNSIQTKWTQASGPGTIVFGSSNSLTTTARFSADGVYGIAITVSNLTTASARVAVVVNPGFGVTNGLQAWWKMDETGGSIATDSSGNGRNATLTSAAFAAGYLSNALQCNGTTSRATFSTEGSNQVTVAAWAFATGQGNSQFPRIVETPAFRFMFRFGSSDINSVGFGTFDTVNGDFDSGGGTIGQGSWFHVAASYDRSNIANLPVFYVNGARVSTVALTMPSGTAPPLAGTGYIGNHAALDRAWSGLIDDVRIYNRILSDAEVQVLAATPPINVAPRVNAGTNQTVVLPGTANLAGSASDDGNPNPPAALNVSWSQVSGPSSVTFGNSNGLSTTASFSVPGNYVLQLAASDGQAQTVSTLSIDVLSQTPIIVQRASGSLILSWSNAGWRLQAQTNPFGMGLGSNWFDVGNSSATNSMVLPIDPTNGNVFYRLIFP